MKKKYFIILFILMSVLAGAQNLKSEIQKLAIDITLGYLENKDDLLFRPRIGIIEFVEETEGAVINSAGALVSTLLTEEFSRSTVFSVIERQNIETLMEEFKLNLSGLTDQSTAPQLGLLQGVDLMIMGSVSEAGEIYIITARLVEVETGRIATSTSIDVRRHEIENESELYQASTFQTPYGITFAPSLIIMKDLSGENNYFSLLSIDAGYRFTRWLTLYLGYTHISSSELKGLDDERIIVTDDNGTDHNVVRYFQFTGDGIKFAATASISPSYRLSLGGQIAAVVYFNADLEQNFPDFPVWLPDGSGGLSIVSDRISINSFNHDLYASYHLNFSADYLISKRLSIFGGLGAYLLPRFIPTSFESSGSIRDTTIESDSDIDDNGTFAQYQSFNFARTIDGERIIFSSLGLSAQIGLSVNF